MDFEHNRLKPRYYSRTLIVHIRFVSLRKRVVKIQNVMVHQKMMVVVSETNDKFSHIYNVRLWSITRFSLGLFQESVQVYLLRWKY